jgi:outer membrane protein OmpA-like peptidoglycan-associated protein
MKQQLSILFIIISMVTYAQSDFLSGTWQGMKVNLGQANEKGNAIWFNFVIDEATKNITGESRIESPFSDYYALKIIKGKLISRNEIEFEDIIFGNKKSSGRAYWCLIKGKLTYNEVTGYLSGDFNSSTCRSNVGKITLYRSKQNMSKSDTVSLYHSWYNNMCNDLKRGWKAYYVRDAEMRNFEFKPIHFDHDMDDLKPQYHEFLEQMVKVVKSHSDLRIKIIGHTDSNGPDGYNVGLSKRRANRIKAYLLSLGIKSDQVVIEYRGEKDPKVSNSTVGGKKLNRRVDFEFI